ncbi:MAG: ATP-binding cassette domain-containing protein [Desulfobacteraceae bacterium]|nr:MAG: ATP-binding cassette domain-containing protein [Desulfobacteraceae bacterium]
MAVVSIQDVSVSFGGPPLLQHIDLQVEKGERVALIGRNGEGKSTLLRLIAGRLPPDSGRIVLQKGSSVGSLDQDLPSGLTGTVGEVAAGLNGAAASKRPQDHEVATVLTRLSLDPNERFENLSVGFKRRVLLARALAADPDLLLLDEPTNHLDIPAIAWMEEYLLKYHGTLFLITHDRAFLRKLATRIVELDRGRVFNWECSYQTFLERRDAALDVEEAQLNRFLHKLAKEEAWIRQGIKARRTRNEGRVRQLMKMREEQQALRARTGSVKMHIEEAQRTGRIVIEAEKISHAYGGKTLIRNFSVRIMRGDRVGIIGPNGVGKTTLLRILLGETPPQEGRVRQGSGVAPVYFDQLRAQLDEERTVQENISEGKEIMDLNGGRRHVIGYLKDFLFSPDRSRSPVRVLSGGERNRLLLARLFSRPSNVLVLDEPTNDLDMETLDLLEDRMLEYSGTILLVSHDREFLNGVVTSTLVFEEDGRITEYAGGYDDWLSQRPQALERKVPVREGGREKAPSRKQRSRKLTFKEARELEELPRQIEELDAEQKALYARMADPEFYREAGEEVSGAKERLDELEKVLEETYARWQELESILAETE